MDGLVTNIALVAGVAAPRALVTTHRPHRPAGLVAGAFSMAMGEYTSVRTQNEQVDREWHKEIAEINEPSRRPRRPSSRRCSATWVVRADLPPPPPARDFTGHNRAALVHVTQELGLKDPRDKPSPSSLPCRRS